jgi:hypothetical protein
MARGPTNCSCGRNKPSCAIQPTLCELEPQKTLFFDRTWKSKRECMAAGKAKRDAILFRLCSYAHARATGNR